MIAQKIPLETSSLEQRLASFDIDAENQIAFQRISDILRPYAEDLADLYLKGFFASSGITVDARTFAEQAAKLTVYSREKYTPPIDAAWIGRVETMGRLQFKLGTPNHANLGSLDRTHRRSAELIFEATPDRADAVYLIDQLWRITALENEVMATIVQTLRNRAFDAHLADNASSFESSIARIATTAHERSGTARDMAAAVDDAAKALVALSQDVAASAVQSTDAMTDAARMSGGLNRAIDAIDGALASAFQTFDDLAETASATGAGADKLSDHEQSIARVVAQISNVADRTGILALNALIEAASAGSAGAGFAVVANEMKALAGQTAQATQDILLQLKGIAATSQQTIAAHATMEEKFSVLRETTGRMRSSLSDQTHSIAQIANRIDETAQSTRSVSQSISLINERASRVSVDIAEVTGNVSELDGQLQDLGYSAQAFLAQLAR